MEEVKVYKSLNKKLYNSKEECLSADKEYLVDSLFINNLDHNKLQSLFRKGSDEFWSFLHNNIKEVVLKNVDIYVDMISPKIKEEEVDNIETLNTKKYKRSKDAEEQQ